MRQYKSWIAALILGSTLSANAQQKNMENKTLNENIPEIIISLEKEALASTDPMGIRRAFRHRRDLLRSFPRDENRGIGTTAHLL